jgi:uncharacterized SAM-binding protein YcdF (DUF218 family)
VAKQPLFQLEIHKARANTGTMRHLLRRALGARGFLRDAIPAGVALFFGGFSLINVAGSLFWSGFDASVWWVDMRALPAWLGKLVLTGCGVALLWFGLMRPRSGIARIAIVSATGFLGTLSLVNSILFLNLSSRGAFVAAIPLPLSLAIAALLGWVLVEALQSHLETEPARIRIPLALFVAGCCAVLFPLAQMFFFGKTDYRRPADVAIVLGARAYADGRPSDALADRVRTGCELYNRGMTRRLLFSGGPGDGAVHETEAMKNMAMSLGVPEQDIILDKQGVNTQATVKNTRSILQKIGARRVLVVSHFYHLPRLKLAYSRDGREVYTVPARESYILRQLPYNMAREVAALWVYYLRPMG